MDYLQFNPAAFGNLIKSQHTIVGPIGTGVMALFIAKFN